MAAGLLVDVPVVAVNGIQSAASLRACPVDIEAMAGSKNQGWRPPHLFFRNADDTSSTTAFLMLTGNPRREFLGVFPIRMDSAFACGDSLFRGR